MRRGQDHFAEYAAVLEDRLEVDLLNEFETHFTAYDLTRDENDRRAIAVRFVEAIDEVQTSRATTAGHRSEAIHQQRLALSRKCAGLLVAHVNEFDPALRERGGKGIECVAHDAVTVLDTGITEYVNDHLRYFLTHRSNSSDKELSFTMRSQTGQLALHLHQLVHGHHVVVEMRHDHHGAKYDERRGK